MDFHGLRRKASAPLNCFVGRTQPTYLRNRRYGQMLLAAIAAAVGDGGRYFAGREESEAGKCRRTYSLLSGCLVAKAATPRFASCWDFSPARDYPNARHAESTTPAIRPAADTRYLSAGI